MGMFDEVVCQYRLPDGWDPGAQVFRTTDTPDQWLTRYVLRADGTLVRAATGAVIADQEAMTLSADNFAALAPWGYATTDGQPLWAAEYHVRFHAGVVASITGGKTACTPPTTPNLTREELRMGMPEHRERSTIPHLTREEWHRRHRAWGAAQELQQEEPDGETERPC